MRLFGSARVLIAATAGLLACALISVIVVAPWSWRSEVTFYLAPTTPAATPADQAADAAIADDRTSSLIAVLRTASTRDRFARAGASSISITGVSAHTFSLQTVSHSRSGARAAAFAAPGIVTVLAGQLSQGLGESAPSTKVVLLDGPTSARRTGGLAIGLLAAIVGLGLAGGGTALVKTSARRRRERLALPELASLTAADPLGDLDPAVYPVAVALGRAAGGDAATLVVVTGAGDDAAIAAVSLAVARGLARRGAAATLIDAGDAGTLTASVGAPATGGLSAWWATGAADLLHSPALASLALLPRGDSSAASRDEVRWFDARGARLVAVAAPHDGYVVVCAPTVSAEGSHVGSPGLALAAAADVVIIAGAGAQAAAARAALAGIGVQPMGRVSISGEQAATPAGDWSVLRTLGSSPAAAGEKPLRRLPPATVEIPDPRSTAEPGRPQIRARAGEAVGALRSSTARKIKP